MPRGVQKAVTGDIEHFDGWGPLLDGVEIVFHLAARVHVLNDTAKDPLSSFRQVNVEGTRKLLQACIDKSVRKFLFMSTVKVHGEGRLEAYREDDPFFPSEPYAISKAEAEEQIQVVADQSHLDTIVIRPPLVYGPRVKANFQKLIHLAYHRIPLPLGSVDNQRSLVFIDNLIDFLVYCFSHPKAVGRTFLVSDGENVSTARLFSKISDAMGKKVRILDAPPFFLTIIGKLTGRIASINRLCGSLTVDASKAEKILGWQPPMTLDQGIKATVDWYLQHDAR